MAKMHSKEGNTAKFEITISAEEFAKARQTAYTKQGKKISVPGFRKGKVPRAIIEQYYGVEVFFDDAINEVLPDLYDAAVKELDIEPVDRPEVDVTEVSAEKGATIMIEVICKPEVKIEKYKGITIHKHDYNVTDEDINAELALMQQRNSRVVTANDNHVLENGNIAVIDFEGFIDGEAFAGGKGDNHSLELGSGSFIPGFEEQVVGHKKGDEIEVKVTFPGEYHAEEFAGKEAIFKVKINEVKIKDLPKLDDEFAKDVSEFDTLKALKDSLKEKKQAENERKSRRDTEDEVIDGVIEQMKVDVPESMVNTEIARIAQNMDHELRHQGLSLEHYFQMTGVTPEAFTQEYHERALNQVKANLAIEAIAKAENIEVADEEIDAEYAKIAAASGSAPESVKEYIPHDGMAHDLRVTKVLDLLIENAKIKK